MVYNGKTISGLSYNGHAIKAAYSCGGNLVFSAETTPTPVGNYKYIAHTTGDTTLSAQCCGYAGCDELMAHDITPRTGSLKDAVLGDCITIIGNSCFAGEVNLTGITMPSTMLYIKSSPFQACDNMVTMTVYATTPPYMYSPYENGDNLFGMQEPDFEDVIIPSNLTIYVPSSALNDYLNDTKWGRYGSVIQAIT